uniref:Uncharacterized protein n=1 Tax=Acrobeloides nanus TaxID=290746 RepID=A0A914DIJ7_9BILA
MYLNRASGVDQNFWNTSVQNDKEQIFSFDPEYFLYDNAAVIDRSGVLLYSMITGETLKNVDGCAICANRSTKCDCSDMCDECGECSVWWRKIFRQIEKNLTLCDSDECASCLNKCAECSSCNEKEKECKANVRQMCAKCESYVNPIVSLVRNATLEYYNKNKIFGCMHRDAYNFNPNANVDTCQEKKTWYSFATHGTCDDGTCQKNYTYKNYTIGGVFQKCEIVTNNESTDPIQHLCHNYSQINIDTNLVNEDYVCVKGFQAVKILDFRMKLPARIEKRKYKKCKGWLFWKTCTDHIDVNIFHDDVAHIESYVCQPSDGGHGISYIEMGYLFGGFYGKNTTNNVTGDMTCPDHFTKHNLFDIVVCLSRDYWDRRFSVELGGFFSCQTKKEEASCPTGFVQHLATTINGCDVYVCLGTDMRLKLPLINRPPFERNPDAVANETEVIINGYVNETVQIQKSE